LRRRLDTAVLSGYGWYVLGDAATAGVALSIAFGQRHADGSVLEMKTKRLRLEDRTYDLYPNRL
jgi:hypothetical protein